MKAHWFFMCAVLWLTSCGGPQTGSDEVEKDHPVVVEARELLKQQDTASAAVLLEGLLRDNPEMAYAHLQLGYVFQTQEEPVKALYHFQRYLEMRSGTENADVVQVVVQDELRRLARRVGMGMEEGEGLQQMEALRLELADAKRLLAQARLKLDQAQFDSGTVSGQPPPEWARERRALLEEIAALREGAGSSQTSVSPGEVISIAPPADSPGVRYTVVRGDNLSLIAKKHYGKASEWRKIFEANRDQLPSPRDLSVGMELKIPE